MFYLQLSNWFDAVKALNYHTDKEKCPSAVARKGWEYINELRLEMMLPTTYVVHGLAGGGGGKGQLVHVRGEAAWCQVVHGLLRSGK